METNWRKPIISESYGDVSRAGLGLTADSSVIENKVEPDLDAPKVAIITPGSVVITAKPKF